MDKRTRSYIWKKIRSKEPLTCCFHYLQPVVVCLFAFCNALIRHVGSVLQLFVPPGVFYASTWPGVNQQFRNRCSTALQILVFTRENSTKEIVNTFLPDWQTRLLHLHWIRPNGHLSSITDALKSTNLSVSLAWIMSGSWTFMEIHMFTNTLEKGRKENEAQVEISLARYRNLIHL